MRTPSEYHVLRQGPPLRSNVVAVIKFDKKYYWTIAEGYKTTPITQAEFETLIEFGIKEITEKELDEYKTPEPARIRRTWSLISRSL